MVTEIILKYEIKNWTCLQEECYMTASLILIV